jgi:membrane protease YdiL (CAAX protease family)
MELRRRAALELGVLALATPLFLVLVPERPVLVDLGLAALGLGLVALGLRETRRRVWGDPVAPEARRRAERALAAATLAGLALLAAIGALLSRPLDAAAWLGFLATAALFAPWAWLQQALFQFYLLGRVRVLLGKAGGAAVAGVGGLLFAAVHAPAWDLVAVTAAAGWLWSWCYLRARRLWPLALSHAALGAGYFAFVRGEDLLTRWLAVLG